MSRFINPITQYILANGDVASAGTLTFYQFDTDTLLNIYSDEDETIPLANPVTLGDRGEVPNIFFSQAARVVLADSDDNQIFDVQPTNIGGGSGGGVSGWDASTTYGQLSIVYASDGDYYVSLTDDNTGNDPVDTTDDSSNWTRLELLRVWNETENYASTQLVIRFGKIYIGQIADNLGNDPATDTLGNWLDITDSILSPYDGTTSGLVSTNVKSAIDELVTLIDAINSFATYKGQLDVSAGDGSLPGSPSNGDLYVISTAGTITVSSNGGAPVSTPVVAGQAIIYNDDDSQWDLIASTTTAVGVSYSNVVSGLTAVNVQTALDEIDGNVDTNATAISGLQSTIAGLASGTSYKGQLDVSAGDGALPNSPDSGDVYYISVGGTITVSVGGASPAAYAAEAGDLIIYNETEVQWDLVVGGASTVVDLAADYAWTGTHSFAIGLLPTDLDLTDDFDFTGALQKDGEDVFTQDNIREALIEFNDQTGTAYTLVLTDGGKTVTMTNAAANIVTVPPNSSVAFPVGTTITIIQEGAGQTSIAEGAGVTINSSVGYNITAQDDAVTLVKRATDTWNLTGRLSA